MVLYGNSTPLMKWLKSAQIIKICATCVPKKQIAAFDRTEHSLPAGLAYATSVFLSARLSSSRKKISTNTRPLGAQTKKNYQPLKVS